MNNAIFAARVWAGWEAPMHQTSHRSLRLICCWRCGQDRRHAAHGCCRACYDRLYRMRCGDCGTRWHVRAGLCPPCTARAARWRSRRDDPPPQGRCPGVAGLACGRAVALTQPPFRVYCLRCGQIAAQAEYAA